MNQNFDLKSAWLIAIDLEIYYLWLFCSPGDKVSGETWKLQTIFQEPN